MAAPRKDNVKDKILDTTEELLLGGSFDNISLANIAQNAGVSKGTLYYHYKTKEEILLDITDRYLNQQWDDFLAWTENKEKDTSIHRLIKYVIERGILETGPRLSLISSACSGNEEIRAKLLERYGKFQKIIADKIGERTVAINPDYISWLVLLVSDGVVIQTQLGNDSLDREKFIKYTEEYVKHITDTFSKSEFV